MEGLVLFVVIPSLLAFSYMIVFRVAYKRGLRRGNDIGARWVLDEWYKTIHGEDE